MIKQFEPPDAPDSFACKASAKIINERGTRATETLIMKHGLGGDDLKDIVAGIYGYNAWTEQVPRGTAAVDRDSEIVDRMAQDEYQTRLSECFDSDEEEGAGFPAVVAGCGTIFTRGRTPLLTDSVSTSSSRSPSNSAPALQSPGP